MTRYTIEVDGVCIADLWFEHMSLAVLYAEEVGLTDYKIVPVQ